MNSSDANGQFAICVFGEADRDLETRKVYRVLPDEEAIAVGCLQRSPPEPRLLQEAGVLGRKLPLGITNKVNNSGFSQGRSNFPKADWSGIDAMTDEDVDTSDMPLRWDGR